MKFLPKASIFDGNEGATWSRDESKAILINIACGSCKHMKYSERAILWSQTPEEFNDFNAEMTFQTKNFSGEERDNCSKFW